MAYLNHNLPTITCYIRNEFLFNHKKGHGEVTLCDVHSVASLEKHVPLFEAFLENGVNWTRRPISDDFMYEIKEIRDSNPVKSSDLQNQEQNGR